MTCYTYACQRVDPHGRPLTGVGIPYPVTLHTVLSEPSPGQARVLRQLCGGAAALTVFTPTAHRLAVACGIAVPGRIHVIGHGAPQVLYTHRVTNGATGPLDPGLRPEIAAALTGLHGATVASTFGLISPNKGLETGIYAVARLADELPNLRYVIAGATHPEVARHDGEDYRDSLTALAGDLADVVRTATGRSVTPADRRQTWQSPLLRTA